MQSDGESSEIILCGVDSTRACRALSACLGIALVGAMVAVTFYLPTSPCAQHASCIEMDRTACEQCSGVRNSLCGWNATLESCFRRE